jgi:hypothetical protein
MNDFYVSQAIDLGDKARRLPGPRGLNLSFYQSIVIPAPCSVTQTVSLRVFLNSLTLPAN